MTAIELTRIKSSHIEKVQAAAIAKHAFKTLVIADFMSLPLNCSFSLYRR
jgi:hypothetical protein